MRSVKPALKAETFTSILPLAEETDRMTLSGVVNKTVISFILLLGLLVRSGGWSSLFIVEV